MFLSAEWLDYWLDIYEGGYVKKPNPVRPAVDFEVAIGWFLEETDMMAEPGEQFEALMGRSPELPAA